ncbi:MAG: AAA family ATPase [Deltaproteobacteria bacterium]|nr:AAA family ATPase [Deltaproteobacteria bacterium]
MHEASPIEFEGTDRFVIRRRLGAGGMGVVYEAWDHEREVPVALKTLTRTDGTALHRFKREFRALANVCHPNLVALHELFSVGDRWFFTMDLVAGIDFVSHIRGSSAEAHAGTLTSTPPFDWYLDEPPEGQLSPDSAPAATFDAGRLRAALAQLARGVGAIHRADKLHRDLKPSNVLVADDGQLTILDFGVIVGVLPNAALESIEDTAVGTPAYMAPEQATGRGVTVAADWYSVGVMLYEALTGVLPFAGTIRALVTAKQRSAPPNPGELVPGLPEDLVSLCLQLLQRKPAARPGEQEILDLLQGELSTTSDDAPRVSSSAGQESPRGFRPFIGRGAQLETLSEAYEASGQGLPVLVQVHGPIGIGKTALVRRFLSDLRSEAVILAGRCHERESVPYQALDSVVDVLARYLRQLPPEEADALMPEDVRALARIFPVLTRVKALVCAAGGALVAADARELRRRGFGALKALLTRIASRQRLILFIDDLQWGDLDSATLLRELLRPPDAPPLLLVVGFRSEERSASPMLRALVAARWSEQPGLHGRDLPVGALDEEECRRLTAALFEGAGPPLSAQATAIAAESDGNPGLITELVRHYRGSGDATQDARTVGIDDVLASRMYALSPEARRLMYVVAVAGAPVPPPVAIQAARLGTNGLRSLIMLRAAMLCRGAWQHGRPAVEVHHDRIRGAVLQTMARHRIVECHERLAAALGRLGPADAERIAFHAEQAGHPRRAADHAARAAAGAVSALAFERAARLYRWALALHGDPEPSPWLAALGDALAHGGRSAEAAEAYLAAGATAEPTVALDLRRRAAEHLLRSGHVERGLALIRQVLEAVGLGLAPTPRRALLSLIYYRTRLRIRGLETDETEVRDLSAEQRIRMDACWSAAVGLAMVDTIHGAEFHARHLLQALDAGEPSRLARALALEAGHVASTGAHRHGRATALIDRSEELAERIGDWHALGLAKTMRGLRAMFAGEWSTAIALTDEATGILLDRCTNVAWELATARRYHLASSYYRGNLAVLARRVPELLADARERGDRFAESCVASGSSVVAWLVRDDSAGARQWLDEALGRSDGRGFQLQDYFSLQAATYVDLYDGRGSEAYERLRTVWREMARSKLLRVAMLRRTMLALRARCAVAAGGRAALDDAEGQARRLVGDAGKVGGALARLIRAGIAEQRGDLELATAALAHCATEFDALGMALKAAAVRRRCGALVGGAEGAALIAQADGFLRPQTVQDPERLTLVVAPG